VLRFTQTFAGLRDSSLPRPGLAPAQYGTIEQCMRNPVLFSVKKNNLIPIPFALAVLDVLNIFTLWKLITLALIAINDYRPALQAVFSVVYTSVSMVNQYYFQCRQTIYRRCPIGAYHDYRSALQAVFSVIYMSVIMVSQHEPSE